MGQSTEELSSEIQGTRERMASDLDALQDRVSPAAIVERRKAAAKGRLTSARDKVMGVAQSAGDGVSSGPSGAAAGVQSGAQGTRDAAASAVGSAQERIEGSPLAAGLVAFGAGLVIAALIPASRAEADLAHQVSEKAKEHAEPVMAQARSAGQDIAQDLKDSATDAAQEVKQSATDSAAKVKDEGTSAARSVKDQA